MNDHEQLELYGSVFEEVSRLEDRIYLSLLLTLQGGKSEKAAAYLLDDEDRTQTRKSKSRFSL